MTNKVELTPEQKDELVAFFQNNDFTANMELDRKYKFEGEQAKIFVRTKKIFGEYWLGNLRKLGVKRKMKKLLQRSSSKLFGERQRGLFFRIDF